MSSVDVGTAFVRVVPETGQFRALLQAQVNAAVAAIKVPPIIATVNVAGTNVGGNTAAAAAAATSNLRGIEKSSEAAAKGIVSARNESRLLQGSLIGLSRVTPVAVFGLGVVGTAAIAAGLAIKGAIGSAAALETQLNVFQAVTGSTSAQMREVASTATALGADLSLPATSANDAAVALTELAKAGLSVEDSIAASRGVLQLSAAANISAGEAAKFAATELNAFGLAGDQASKITDLLAGASIAAQGEIQDFANAFQQTAAAANSADISVETTTGLLTELARAGIRGADAGTSLRTTILRLVPTTKEAAQFQKALGIELDRNATIGEQLPNLIEQYRTALLRLPPADKIEALNQIFGQDAFRAASIFFTQAPGQLERVTAEVNRTGAGAELAEARTKGFAGSIEGLKSSAQTLGTSLGETVLPALTEITKTLSSLTTQASDAVSALKPLSSAISSTADSGLGDAQGPILLAGLGLVAKRLLASRATAKAVEAANVAAAQKTLVSWEVAERELTAATILAADKQIAAATAVGAANVRAAGVASAAWKLEASVATVAAGSAAKNILASNKGLVAGLIATIAGSQLSERGGTAGVAGGFLLGAGQGALVGSFFGPAGVAVGAAAGGFLAQLSNAKKETQRNKESWDALSFEEQLQVLRDLGSKSGQFLSTFGLKLKANPFSAAAAATISSITPPGLGDITPNLAIRPGSTGVRSSFADSFGKFLKAENAALPQATQEAVLGRKNQLDLNLALAQMSGSTAQVESALRAQAAFDRKLIKTLQANLASPNKDLSDFKFSLKERTQIAATLKVTIAELLGIEKELTEEAVRTFTIPANLTIGSIRAGATKSLQDNLAADQAIVDAYQRELASTKATGAELDQVKVGLAQAQAQVVRDQQAIADESARNADIVAQNMEKNAAARELVLRTIADIQQQSRDNILASALATPGLGDDRSAFGLQLKALQKQKDDQLKLGRAAEGGSQAALDAQLKVTQLDEKIFDVKQSIKNLGKDGSGGGGFSLQDLFQEAVNQFNQFGSNVSSSVVTGGGARAAVAGGILAQRPQDAFGRAVAQNTQEQLNKAATTNELLAGILSAVSGGRTVSASRGGTSPGETSFEQARGLGRAVRGF